MVGRRLKVKGKLTEICFPLDQSSQPTCMTVGKGKKLTFLNIALALSISYSYLGSAGFSHAFKDSWIPSKKITACFVTAQALQYSFRSNYNQMGYQYDMTAVRFPYSLQRMEEEEMEYAPLFHPLT